MKIFEIVAKDSACQALLGANPTRFTPFGAVEHSDRPYAVYQIIDGAPENYYGQRPDLDNYLIQVDVYADTYDEVVQVGEAIRDAIELKCYITAWRGITRETETKLYRLSFDSNWWVSR